MMQNFPLIACRESLHEGCGQCLGDRSDEKSGPIGESWIVRPSGQIGGWWDLHPDLVLDSLRVLRLTPPHRSHKFRLVMIGVMGPSWLLLA